MEITNLQKLGIKIKASNKREQRLKDIIEQIISGIKKDYEENTFKGNEFSILRHDIDRVTSLITAFYFLDRSPNEMLTLEFPSPTEMKIGVLGKEEYILVNRK